MSNSMGLALYQTGKASFQSLNDLTDCFKAAFAGATDSCFEPKAELYEAEKIRHLLAHRGGLIDAKFKREMADFPAYSSQVVGDRIRLTGPVVCKHIEASVTTATDLLETVDTWLENNAQRNWSGID